MSCRSIHLPPSPPPLAEPTLPLVCERCAYHGKHRGHETHLASDEAPIVRLGASARVETLRTASDRVATASSRVADTVDALMGPIAEKRGRCGLGLGCGTSLL
jgi:hypothetical protein